MRSFAPCLGLALFLACADKSPEPSNDGPVDSDVMEISATGDTASESTETSETGDTVPTSPTDTATTPSDPLPTVTIHLAAASVIVQLPNGLGWAIMVHGQVMNSAREVSLHAVVEADGMEIAGDADPEVLALMPYDTASGTGSFHHRAYVHGPYEPLAGLARCLGWVVCPASLKV